MNSMPPVINPVKGTEMKIKVPEAGKPRIEMLPLIDIVFLLLVVFIYSMLSMSVHRGLAVTLPESAVADIETKTPVSVTVRGENEIYVNEIRVALTELPRRLMSEPENRDVRECCCLQKNRYPTRPCSWFWIRSPWPGSMTSPCRQN